MAATQTFPDIEMGEGTTEAIQNNSVEAPFGDGYTQRAVDGLNNERRIYDVVFDALSYTDYETILAFMQARSWNVEAFLWTPPNDDTERQWTYVKNSWKRVFHRGGQTVSLTMQFREEFDL